MAHAVVDLLIVQCLEVHSERLQPGRLVSVMVDEVDVVLPEVLFRKVVGLYCANRCLARQDSSDQPGTNAACAYRIGKPCRVATDHVPIRDETIVLVSHRDLPASGQVAVIAERSHLFEPVVCCEPVLQKCAQGFRASLLLNAQTDVDFVFAFRKQPEITSRSLLLVEVDVAVEGLDLNTVPEFCRSEEHTSELQSRENLVCRLL